MSQKCDSAAYKRRRKKEKANARERSHRIILKETGFQEWRRKPEAEQRELWLRDPRRQNVHELVNLLARRAGAT